MNATAKILLAHYFPNIILFKISHRINLNFGVTIVALDLKLLRKNKIGLPITTSQFQNEEKCLDIFWADGRCTKTYKYKNFKFSANYRDIYKLNVYVNRIFVKNFVRPVGRPNNYVPNSVQKTIKG